MYFYELFKSFHAVAVRGFHAFQCRSKKLSKSLYEQLTRTLAVLVHRQGQEIIYFEIINWYGKPINKNFISLLFINLQLKHKSVLNQNDRNMICFSFKVVDTCLNKWIICINLISTSNFGFWLPRRSGLVSLILNPNVHQFWQNLHPNETFTWHDRSHPRPGGPWGLWTASPRLILIWIIGTRHRVMSQVTMSPPNDVLSSSAPHQHLTSAFSHQLAEQSVLV